jgi:hypothetical protein
VEFNHEKSKEKVKSALKGMKGMPPPVINSLEACCMVGMSLQFNSPTSPKDEETRS